MKRLTNWLESTFFPLRTIASELIIIRELYEQELSTRPIDLGGPVMRITEEGKPGDVEFFNVHDIEQNKRRRKSALSKLIEGDDEEQDQD